MTVAPVCVWDTVVGPTPVVSTLDSFAIDHKCMPLCIA